MRADKDIFEKFTMFTMLIISMGETLVFLSNSTCLVLHTHVQCIYCTSFKKTEPEHHGIK